MKCEHKELGIKVLPYRNWLGKLEPIGVREEGPEGDLCIDDQYVFCLSCRKKVSEGIEVPDINEYVKRKYG